MDKKTEKVTAVEWLTKELKKRFKRNQSHQTDSQWCFEMINKLSDQAIEMEKEQKQEEFGKGYLKCSEDFKIILEKGVMYDSLKADFLKQLNK